MEQPLVQQLLELARQDDLLRMALLGASSVDEVQAIAAQRGLTLSEEEIQQWLTYGGALNNALSDEELEAISGGKDANCCDTYAISNPGEAL